MSAPPERPTPRGSGNQDRTPTGAIPSSARWCTHPGPPGQDDHLKALTGTTDVQGHAVRRGNSQLIYVPQSCRESGWMAPAHRHERSRPPRRMTASAPSAEAPSTPAKSLRSADRCASDVSPVNGHMRGRPSASSAPVPPSTGSTPQSRSCSLPGSQHRLWRGRRRSRQDGLEGSSVVLRGRRRRRYPVDGSELFFAEFQREGA